MGGGGGGGGGGASPCLAMISRINAWQGHDQRIRKTTETRRRGKEKVDMRVNRSLLQRWGAASPCLAMISRINAWQGHDQRIRETTETRRRGREKVDMRVNRSLLQRWGGGGGGRLTVLGYDLQDKRLAGTRPEN